MACLSVINHLLFAGTVSHSGQTAAGCWKDAGGWEAGVEERQETSGLAEKWDATVQGAAGERERGAWGGASKKQQIWGEVKTVGGVPSVCVWVKAVTFPPFTLLQMLLTETNKLMTSEKIENEENNQMIALMTREKEELARENQVL